MHLALQRHQAGNLVLLVLLLMHSRPTVHLTSPQTPPIDLDGDHFRRSSHSGGQFAAAVLDRFVVALLCHLGANLRGDALDVTRTDLDPGEVQGEGGVGGGVQFGISFSDHLKHGRAVAAVVQTQRGP
jgi:hypothetical protein